MRMREGTKWGLAIALSALGCSSSNGSDGNADNATSGPSSSSSGGAASAVSSGGAIGTTASGGSAADSGGASGRSSASGGAVGSGGSGALADGGEAGVADTATGGGGTGGGEPDEPVELPPGSREVDGIVNLVDAEAADELETFLLATTETHLVLRSNLSSSWNLFVEHYLESYDFVFFVTDHVVDGVTLTGKFEAINRPAESGSGNEIEIAAGGYRTDGRVKGVIGIPYFENYYPPFSHEMGHYWAVWFDTRFGFGAAFDQHYGPHWGFSSVNGQLGGFDGSTLRCETPSGAMPPNCTPETSGRTRYAVGLFGPTANGFRAQPFAPLELYTMGLAPASDVPDSFMMLRDAAIDDASIDESSETMVVEASSLDTLPFSEIVARHGNVRMLEPAERHFKAAFVVLSTAPASDSILSDVARWAAVLGNRSSQPPLTSFEEDTRGAATLDTELGPRRDVSDPPPAIRDRFVCDPIAQDCGRPELACVLYPPAFCVLSGGVELDQPCDAAYACAPGLDCVSGSDAPDEYFCEPYCDPTTTSSDTACDTLCPGNYLTMRSSEDELLGGLCLP